MQKITNLEDAMQRLRGFLTQYLKDKEIDPSKNFRCINPKHEDHNPSMTCKQNPENAFCLACGATADIFQAAHWLDNKPISGQEFLSENVLWLAQRYGVEVELQEMTEEDAYRARTYQVYRDAANLIANPKFGDYTRFDEEVKRRRWDKELLQGALVGTVNYKEFRETLKGMGYEARFIDDVDLGREEIFDNTNMIFTICDEVGRPVGFSARNLIYTPDKDENNKPKNGSKYMNQKTTGVRCNIYQKGRRLYGLNIAKKNVPPLYIFEGYADVITAWHFGLLNCVGIGGTAFTSQHIDTLKQTGCYNIILCLDGDAPGKQRTIELLDKFFRGQKDMQIGVINMPNDMDPDDLLREKGLEEFLKLKRWSAFEWRLACYSDDDNPEEICRNMIPLIVSESSCIAQDKMCSDLSRFTGIDKKVITSELDRLINERQREKQREKEAILDQTMVECRKNPGDTKALLYQCLMQIEQVEEKYDENSFSPESVIEFIDYIKRFEDTKSSEFAGWKLSSLGLGPFGDNLNGNWREDVFVAFGGAANAGKCQSENTEILMPTGEYKKIKDIIKDRDEFVATMNNSYKIVAGRVTNWINSGILECFRLTTRDGLDIESSKTHPYFTLDGWKTLENLKPGDKIAITSSYTNLFNIEHGKAAHDDVLKAEIIAGFLAEGSITCSTGFSNTDEELLERFKSNIRELFGNINFRYDNNRTLYVTTERGKPNPVLDYLRELDMHGKNSHTKEIPSYIFKLSPRVISKFLGFFYACDGWVHHSEDFDKVEIGLSLCNKRMLTQIRSLLLRFGIRTRIDKSSATCSKDGKRFNKFTLCIRDLEGIRKFYNNIKIPLSSKQAKLQSILDSSREARGSYIENYDASLWLYINQALQERQLTFQTLMKLVNPLNQKIGYDKEKDRYKVSAAYTPRKESGIPRTLLRSIGYLLQDQFLINLSEGDIYFDEVVAIEPIGKIQCYDLTVNTTHNFIANDIVAHNSSLVCQLLWEIASNPENDATVIYHTIDDSKEQILPRFICHAYGHYDLTMNNVRNINYYRKHDELLGETLAARRDTGYHNLRELITDGRIIIKDAQDGAGLAYGESLIRYYRRKYPNRKIVYALDNLHKAPDFDGLKDLRSKYKALSNQFKHIATSQHVCCIATVEYIKLPPGTIPNNNNIAETRSLVYDANLILHLYNDLHERSVEAEVLHEHEGQTLPRIRLGYGKNKVTEFKDRIFLDFFPASGIFRAVDTQGAVADIRARRTALRNNNAREGGSAVEGRETEVFSNA